METVEETAGVEPGTARWQELVQQGIAIDAARNWFLGDAALEIAPMGDDGVKTGVLDNLAAYAREIGIEYNSLRAYRDVAHAWPPPTRVGASSWSVHRELIAHRDLIAEGMTVAAARAAVDQAATGKLAALIPCADGCDYPDDSEVCGVCGVEFNEPDWAIDPGVAKPGKTGAQQHLECVKRLVHHVETEVAKLDLAEIEHADDLATIRTYADSTCDVLAKLLEDIWAREVELSV